MNEDVIKNTQTPAYLEDLGNGINVGVHDTLDGHRNTIRNPGNVQGLGTLLAHLEAQKTIGGLARLQIVDKLGKASISIALCTQPMRSR